MKLMRSFYFWIFVAFTGGILLGLACPSVGVAIEPLATCFVRLLKLFVGPLVFLTVVTGIAQTGSLKKLGVTGFKAFLYFEVVSTVALLIGWAAASLIKPGAAMHVRLDSLNVASVSQYVDVSTSLSVSDYLQHLVPVSFVEPFASGNMLQILLLAILSGAALLGVGESAAKPITEGLERLTRCVFQAIRIVLYAAPAGIFGAMAMTMGKYGVSALLPLLGLIGTFYLTAILFVVFILGSIARISGFSLFKLLRYLSAELWLVLGTSSSEAALPQLIGKLQMLGCERETVGVVVPMGYSFNLDGTNIYITLAALFIAQALGVELTVMQQAALFVTAMLTSKGAAGVTGAGFVTLAATLSVVPDIPVAGIVLVLGIDRFMSDVRALVNYIGNGVAALAISRHEGEMRAEDLQKALSGTLTPDTAAVVPELAGR